jgi:hypothetical protein
MDDRSWYPYEADQQFGQRGAADADLADAMLAALESTRPAPPRAGNKADPGRRYDERFDPRRTTQ